MIEYSMLYPKVTVSRRCVSMDGMWKFKLDEKEEGEKKIIERESRGMR